VGGEAADWVGRGAGVDDEGLKRKARAAAAAVARHRDHLGDPLEVLRRVGGREIAADCRRHSGRARPAGAGAARWLCRLPGAAILRALDPAALDHCMRRMCRRKSAHAEVLRRLGKRPILDLGMRLGEGSGAALATGVVKAALACHLGMATFAEAGVAGKQR